MVYIWFHKLLSPQVANYSTPSQISKYYIKRCWLLSHFYMLCWPLRAKALLLQRRIAHNNPSVAYSRWRYNVCRLTSVRSVTGWGQAHGSSLCYQPVDMNAAEQRGIMSVWRGWIGRQNKSRGFISVMTAKTLTDHTKVSGFRCEMRRSSITPTSLAATTIKMVFSTFRALAALKMEGYVKWLMAVYCNPSPLLIALSQLKVNYNGQENTCTWLHATPHGKFIFHSMLWKTSVLPVQSHSGEQHILWQRLSVSVKGICLAVFIERVCFWAMRVTERASGSFWKEKSRCQQITCTVFFVRYGVKVQR